MLSPSRKRRFQKKGEKDLGALGILINHQMTIVIKFLPCSVHNYHLMFARYNTIAKKDLAYKFKYESFDIFNVKI